MSQKTIQVLGGESFNDSYYQVNRCKMQEASASPHTFGVDEARLLLSGVAVVLPAYIDTLQGATRHEVFPAKTIAPDRSAHEVAFGRIMGHNPNVRSETARFSVAMKPFNRARDALHEMYGYMLLKELGVETFQPIGVFPAKKGSHCIVLSENRKDLMSLDRDEWVIGRDVSTVDQAETAVRNNKTVTEIAQTLAFLHSNGVFHPDGQIKNFAITYDGQIGVIDTENLKSSEVGDSSNPGLAWDDIEKLVHSLVASGGDSDKIFGVGMLSSMTLGEVRRSAQELVIDPYVDAVLGFTAESHAESGLNMAMHVQEQFEMDKTWPGFFIS